MSRYSALFWAVLLVTPFCPILARMPTSIEGEMPRKYWQFIFLYERTSTVGQTETILHPFFSHYTNEEKAYSYSTVLYPIFYSHGTNYWKKWTALYLFTGDDFYHEETKEDTDIFLAPFFYWGSGDTEKERYFSIFPFYGRIRSKIGYSEIQYVLLNLYVTWAYRDYRAYSILWPVLMWGGSPTRSDFRFLFVYSSKIHTGKYEHRSVLWPLIQWGYDDLDKQEPRGYFLAWPFYGRKWSQDGNLSAHAILPVIPLMAPVIAAWGSDKKTNTFDLKLFLGLYQYGYSDNPIRRMNIIFPFYGYYRFAEFEGTFIALLYSNLKTHSLTDESEYTTIVPFYWDSVRHHRQERETENYFKIWPIFQYIKDSRGNAGFRTLVLWPWRSDEFEKIWGPLYSLLEYQVYENGDRYFATMFRIYSQYWNEREFHMFLLGFEYHRTPTYWSVEFLGGFLGFSRETLPEKDPVNTLKLFWFDI